MAGSAQRWDDVSTHDPAFQMIQPIRFGGEFGTSVAAVGGLNHDGIQDMDLAVNCTGFDVVAILFGDGQGGFTLGGHFPVDTLSKGLDVAT